MNVGTLFIRNRIQFNIRFMRAKEERIRKKRFMFQCSKVVEWIWVICHTKIDLRSNWENLKNLLFCCCCCDQNQLKIENFIENLIKIRTFSLTLNAVEEVFITLKRIATRLSRSLNDENFFFGFCFFSMVFRFFSVRFFPFQSIES